jgi:hypothetical protein
LTVHPSFLADIRIPVVLGRSIEERDTCLMEHPDAAAGGTESWPSRLQVHSR